MVDDLVLFHDVKGIRSAAPALFCWIEEQSVRLARLPRLPRRHIRGRLSCRGYRSKLFIRRWLGRDRDLIDRHGAAVASPHRSLSRPRRVRLHLVRGAGNTQHAN